MTCGTLRMKTMKRTGAGIHNRRSVSFLQRCMRLRIFESHFTYSLFECTAPRSVWNAVQRQRINSTPLKNTTYLNLSAYPNSNTKFKRHQQILTEQTTAWWIDFIQLTKVLGDKRKTFVFTLVFANEFLLSYSECETFLVHFMMRRQNKIFLIVHTCKLFCRRGTFSPTRILY